MKKKICFDYVNKYFKKYTHVLEVGCGKNPMICLFPDKYYIGVDKNVKTEGCIINKNVKSLGFKDNFFDIACGIFFLKMTCKNLEPCIKEICRVTKQGCIFIEPLYEHQNIKRKIKTKQGYFADDIVLSLKKYFPIVFVEKHVYNDRKNDYSCIICKKR